LVFIPLHPVLFLNLSIILFLILRILLFLIHWLADPLCVRMTLFIHFLEGFMFSGWVIFLLECVNFNTLSIILLRFWVSRHHLKLAWKTSETHVLKVGSNVVLVVLLQLVDWLSRVFNHRFVWVWWRLWVTIWFKVALVHHWSWCCSYFMTWCLIIDRGWFHRRLVLVKLVYWKLGVVFH